MSIRGRNIGRPANACMTLGFADFIRVPWPAANRMAAMLVFFMRRKLPQGLRPGQSKFIAGYFGSNFNEAELMQ